MWECDAELDPPAMLMLAGVAFREAGVRVRLLLLGVTPGKSKEFILRLIARLKLPIMND